LALGIHGWALAAIVGLHPDTYRNLEVGRRKASPAEARAIDVALTTLERATVRARRASRQAVDLAARP
jgi:hypothetical protein